jgi:hypothetical protein
MEAVAFGLGFRFASVASSFDGYDPFMLALYFFS